MDKLSESVNLDRLGSPGVNALMKGVEDMQGEGVPGVGTR